MYDHALGGFQIARGSWLAVLDELGARAAAVKADITPEKSQWLMGYAARQSTGVHDHIYHRVVAMEAGDVQFYFIASDYFHVVRLKGFVEFWRAFRSDH